MSRTTAVKTAKLTAKDRAEIVRRVEQELAAAKNGTRGRIYTTHEEVRVSDMKVSKDAQRKTNMRRVEKMAANFDPFAIGTLLLSKRAGEYWVIDGGHRWAMLNKIGWADQLLTCTVYHGLTVSEEAALFLKFAERVNLNSFERFRISLVSKDEIACSIQAVLDSLNMKIYLGPGKNTVSAVAALEAVYTNSGRNKQRNTEGTGRYHHVLRDTLKTLREAFGEDSTSFDGSLIRAVGMILHHTQGAADLDRLVKVMARTGGPAQLLGLGANEHRTLRGPLPKATAEAIRKLYNVGIRTDSNRIPSLYR